jgi:alpha-ketoglutarate-dependent taurine dioxygenase
VAPAIMTIQTIPFTLPLSADPSKLAYFGREVVGVDPGNLSPSDFAEIQRLLYKVPFSPRERSSIDDLVLFQHDALLFRNVNLSPEQQYALTKVLYPRMPHESPSSNCQISADASGHLCLPLPTGI